MNIIRFFGQLHTSRGFDDIFHPSGDETGRDAPDGVLKKGSILRVPPRVPSVSRSLAPSSVKYFTEDARDAFDGADPRNRLVSSLPISSYIVRLYPFLIIPRSPTSSLSMAPNCPQRTL